MPSRYHFVAISGSFRKGSYNTMTLKMLQKLAPEHIEIEHLSIIDVPFYNADLHSEKFPEVVNNLCSSIKAADALILVSPEYNYSVPGGLKNAIDILSRHPDKPFDMKPVGILGASTGLLGTARAQYHLRQIMVFVNAYVMNRSEVMISKAADKFDTEGNLKDEKTAEFLKTFVNSLADFSNMINRKNS
jgi:chromate reductase, NAD(P)H dehydrogenase (quinone)